MIRYARQIGENPFFAGFTDIDEFITVLAGELQHNSLVKVEMQPGDATRYVFRLSYTFRDKHLVVFDDNNDKSFIITKDTDPWTLDANPFTACVMCEIYQKLFIGDMERKRHYDWDKACPIRHGAPIR